MTPARVDGTYGERLQREMARQRITIRGLENATGYSYEHLRKIVSGLPLMSKACNAAICGALALDEGEMWQCAIREKRRRRTGSSTPYGSEQWLGPAWELLTAEERERLRRIADGWIASREAEE